MPWTVLMSLRALQAKGGEIKFLLLPGLRIVCVHHEQIITLLWQGSSEINQDFPFCHFLETVPKKVTNGEGELPFWRGLNQPMSWRGLNQLWWLPVVVVVAKRIICLISSVVIVVKGWRIRRRMRTYNGKKIIVLSKLSSYVFLFLFFLF